MLFLSSSRLWLAASLLSSSLEESKASAFSRKLQSATKSWDLWKGVKVQTSTGCLVSQSAPAPWHGEVQDGPPGTGSLLQTVTAVTYRSQRRWWGSWWDESPTPLTSALSFITSAGDQLLPERPPNTPQHGNSYSSELQPPAESFSVLTKTNEASTSAGLGQTSKYPGPKLRNVMMTWSPKTVEDRRMCSWQLLLLKWWCTSAERWCLLILLLLRGLILVEITRPRTGGEPALSSQCPNMSPCGDVGCWVCLERTLDKASRLPWHRRLPAPSPDGHWAPSSRSSVGRR